MSKIALSGNASGTGTLTIAAPNTSTDRTLTLPDQTGTLLTGSGAIGVNSSAATDSLVIDASGQVGIGTSSPGSSRLAVLGTQSTTLGSTVKFVVSGGQGFYLNSETGSINRIAVGTGEAMAFNIGSTEQARITSAGLFQFNSGYGSVATAYGCRAWVNFNGTGTVAIRASGNVSSITDNGTGTFRINFATSMTDSNYAAVGTAVNSSSYLVGITSASNNQADYIDIRVTTDAGSLNDPNFCYYAFFR